MGKVVVQHGWYNAGYIFPLGYKSRLLFRSSVDLDALCVHECEVIGTGGRFWPGPTFRVVAADRPQEPIDAKSCTGCWTGVSEFVINPIAFCLAQPSLGHHICSLSSFISSARLQILKRINAVIQARIAAGEPLPPPPRTAIAGPEYFGFNEPTIQEAVEALDLERQCTTYWAGKKDRCGWPGVHLSQPLKH